MPYPARMRIIAGEFRGRRIAPPVGRSTRPMLDRVREALFSTLDDRVDGSDVLDLFAGTGSLGLEALSRGADRVRFVERDAAALALLRRNVADLDVAGRAEVARGDATDPRCWGIREAQPTPYGVVFVDPPYAALADSDQRRAVLDAVAALVGTRLVPGGVLVLHTPPRGLLERELPRVPLDRREYGRTALWYLRKPEEDGA